MVVFLVVNIGLWVVWAADGADSDDLWPAWVTGIWFVILVLDAFKAYGGDRSPTSRSSKRSIVSAAADRSADTRARVR